MAIPFPTSKKQISTKPIQLAIYVPSTKDYDKPISDTEFKARISIVTNFLNKLFEGSTRIRGIGSYNLGKKTINEKVAIVETFTTKSKYNKHANKVRLFLLAKRKTWSQDSIGLEFEDNFFEIK